MPAQPRAAPQAWAAPWPAPRPGPRRAPARPAPRPGPGGLGGNPLRSVVSHPMRFCPSVDKSRSNGKRMPADGRGCIAPAFAVRSACTHNDWSEPRRQVRRIGIRFAAPEISHRRGFRTAEGFPFDASLSTSGQKRREWEHGAKSFGRLPDIRRTSDTRRRLSGLLPPCSALLKSGVARWRYAGGVKRQTEKCCGQS